ncbi:uncharacterized protein BDZ99DRAFT_461936 [Mytilinidion resinicola]|uniref:Uncharacterized protein n=1 Tax=Mytilinidion resinicola TaxID=574789 RepID=A0A6A6YTY0_9PEZI|nr:uncharacterized protein BDZ99DRAFT_461936 [Mytilinidion resinicola]KAF2811989.1 hypothetical protein BDZ99DRAFT_461936 [Mytilinidion resinicola]
MEVLQNSKGHQFMGWSGGSTLYLWTIMEEIRNHRKPKAMGWEVWRIKTFLINSYMEGRKKLLNLPMGRGRCGRSKADLIVTNGEVSKPSPDTATWWEVRSCSNVQNAVSWRRFKFNEIERLMVWVGGGSKSYSSGMHGGSSKDNTSNAMTGAGRCSGCSISTKNRPDEPFMGELQDWYYLYSMGRWGGSNTDTKPHMEKPQNFELIYSLGRCGGSKAYA